MPRRRRGAPREGAPAPARTPKRRGRPPAIADEAAVARMLEAVGAGVPILLACVHAGISESAHYRAMEAGELAQEQADARTEALALGNNPDDAAPRPDPTADRYREYREKVNRARARVAVVNVALVAKAARGGSVIRETKRKSVDDEGNPVEETEKEYAPPQWKAAEFLLRTSFSRDFAVTSRQEHTGADGGPMQVEHMPAGEAALQATADRIAEVFQTQSQQLPGGWTPPADGEGVRVIEGEVADGMAGLARQIEAAHSEGEGA